MATAEGEEEDRFEKVEHASAADLPCRIFVVNRVPDGLDYPGFPRNAREMAEAFGAALEVASRRYGAKGKGPACTLTTFELSESSAKTDFLTPVRKKLRTMENHCSVDLLRRTLMGAETGSLLSSGPTLFLGGRDAPRTDETSFPLYFELSRSRENPGRHWYEVEVYREGTTRAPRPGSKDKPRRVEPAQTARKG